MSRQNVLKELRKIHTELKKKNSEYRKATSDIKVHILIVSYGRLMNQVIAQLEKGGSGGGGGNFGPGFKKNHPDMYTELQKLVRAFAKNLIAEFQKLSKVSTKYEIEVKKTSQYRAEITVALASKEEGSVFDYIKAQKKTLQAPIIDALDDYIVANKTGATKGVTKFRDENRKSKSGKDLSHQFYFLELGHKEVDAVSQQQIRAAKVSLDALVASEKGLPPEYLEQFGLAIDVDTTKEPEKLTVYLESNFINRSQGTKDKQKAQAIQDDLEKIINNISADKWGEFEASDSPVSKREKKVLNALALALPHGKNVKHNIRSQKIKTSKVTETTAEKRKAKKGSASLYKSAPTLVGKTAGGKKPSGKKARQQSHFNMISMINTKLPRTVKKNMSFPRMENVSGRFADSVKITDVSQTPKGFPSIGYTYQKEPYQVFETGSRGNWSSPERDPRQLIDYSIREIAAELALGRFYTRRV